MIPSAEIQRVAKGEVSDKVVEKDYIQTWLLIGLSSAGLGNELIFKGGTALRKFYYENYRYSEDLDFTLAKEDYKNRILEGFEKIIPVLRELANIPIQLSQKYEEFQNTVTCYMNYTGPLGGRIERNEIKIDITIRELILYPMASRRLLSLYSDQPENITYPVYSLEEIVIEKLCSILDPARHEPRDIYDFWWLMEHSETSLEFLTNDFLQKRRFKKLEMAELKTQVEKKEPIYKRLWETRLKNQMSNLPPFESVYRRVRKHLRMARLL